MRKVQTQVQNLEKTLGSGIERMTLDEAKRDPFISARLSAQVLQDQLIGKIQARKFELSRVENHSRRPAMGMWLSIIFHLFVTFSRGKALRSYKGLCAIPRCWHQIPRSGLQSSSDKYGKSAFICT